MFWANISTRKPTTASFFSPRSTCSLREPLPSGARSLKWWWSSSCFSPSAGAPSRSLSSSSRSTQTSRPPMPPTRSRPGPTACLMPTPPSILLCTASWGPASASPSRKPSRSYSNTRSGTAVWTRAQPTQRSSLLPRRKATMKGSEGELVKELGRSCTSWELVANCSLNTGWRPLAQIS